MDVPEGPFQSDALLVPENCLFDHIHNQTKCWEFGKWNATASLSCQDREMQLKSFAMLLPCGISLFSGVEFVCCPKHYKPGMLLFQLENILTLCSGQVGNYVRGLINYPLKVKARDVVCKIGFPPVIFYISYHYRNFHYLLTM